ncbi:MAG: YbgF trimerization domain-containing protein [Cellvibrionaceae bacterium]
MMMLSSTTVARLAAVFLFMAYAVNVSAQANVRESSPVTPGAVVASPALGPPPPVAEPASSSYNQAYQIQQLQQEILELRGLVEEQGFELKRLKQQRLDDYLDLDKRIGELSSTASQGSASNNKPGSLNSGSLTGTPDDSEAEKKLYREAIDQLLNKQDYKSAQESFNRYLVDYPQGSHAPNVYYWQGQIYLTEANASSAEKSFSTLIDTYPDHQKTPDAKYKLATIYFDQGKKAEAKVLLDDVAASNSDASRLAKSFLANQYK